jgi:hypothetical protein
MDAGTLFVEPTLVVGVKEDDALMSECVILA